MTAHGDVESLISGTALQNNATLASGRSDVQPTSTGGATIAPFSGSASKSHGQTMGLSLLPSVLRVVSAL